jgi:NAD(P)-dependent dehydrogenase (short-subunit alcohol dehydrogenase family)
VTGAAGGIGFATAKLFVERGAKVMLVDRDGERLAALASELGDSAAWFAADVSSTESAEAYVAETVKRFGGLDVLHANAGTEGKVAPIMSLPLEDFDRVIAVNLRGVFLGLRAAAPELEKRGGGSIVITSSVAGVIGSAGLSAYVASKHAVIGLMRTAAVEFAPMKIRVNTVNPGPIENRMMRSIEEQAAPGHGDDVKAGFLGMVPLTRYGTNEEIAALVGFLASDDASYCTGGVFMADGGFTAQ